MKFTGYITIRLNSKRVPRKSIRKLAGRSLIDYAISTLNQIEEISETILYCSQKTHEELLKHINSSLTYTHIERPAYLDSDITTFNEILETLIENLDTDYIVFLCCTSPFIRYETIKYMIKQVEQKDFDSSFTAFNIHNFCWFKNHPFNYDPSNVPRTQDLEPVMVETSGLYIFSKELFIKNRRRIGYKPYIKIIDTFEGWDIDTLEDWKMAELIGNYVHNK